MQQLVAEWAHAFTTHLAAMTPLLERYGYAGIFVSSLVEGFGIPAPGQTLLAVGALLAARGQLDIVAVVACAWCATVIGNAIGYAVGRVAGRRLLLRAGVRRDRIRRVEAFVRRYGPAILIAARFVDGLRQTSSIVAGSMQMPWHAFALSILLGTTLWVAAIGAGAYTLGRDFHAIAGLLVSLRPYAWILVAGLLAALVIYLMQRPGRGPHAKRPK